MVLLTLAVAVLIVRGLRLGHIPIGRLGLIWTYGLWRWLIHRYQRLNDPEEMARAIMLDRERRRSCLS